MVGLRKITNLLQKLGEPSLLGQKMESPEGEAAEVDHTQEFEEVVEKEIDKVPLLEPTNLPPAEVVPPDPTESATGDKDKSERYETLHIECGPREEYISMTLDAGQLNAEVQL